MSKLILGIKTDQPSAYVCLLLNGTCIAEKSWQAHRQLSDTLLLTIESLLSSQSKSWSDLEGIIAFKGPGSFTGLRIGATVANTLAHAIKIPVAGTNGDSWLSDGQVQLNANPSNRLIDIEYGGEAHITSPRK